MRAVGVAAQEKAAEEIAAEIFVLRRERSFVGARAEADLILASERICGHAVAHARKLEPMQREGDFSGRVGTDFNALARGAGNEREQFVNAGLTTLERRGGRESVHEAGIQIAGITKVDERELFAALVESEKRKIRGGVVKPCHALGGSAKCACGNNDFETAEVAARLGVLAAVVEPEDAESENTVDDGCGFSCADADDGIGGSSLEQAAAHIGGAEAVLEIHGRAQAVDFRPEELAGEHALEEAEIVAAGGVAGRGSAAVAGGDELEELRLRGAHAAGCQAQGMRARLGANDGANQVAFFAPELEKATAVGFGNGVMGGAHVKKNAAVFEQGGGGVIG